MSLISSNDTAVSWQRIKDFNLLDNYDRIDIVSRVGNNIFLYLKVNGSSPYDIYKLNVITKQLDKILTLPIGLQPTTQGVQKVGEKYYFSGVYYIEGGMKIVLYEIKGMDKDSAYWVIADLDKRYNGLVIDAKNDSLIYLSSYDSLMKSDVIWFAKAKTGTSVKNDIESINTFSFFPTDAFRTVSPVLTTPE